jgi:thioredoxin-related protein
MKKLYILTLLILGALTANAQSESIKWVSINELETLQKKEPRKVLIDVYTKWCGPCKMMMAQTFTNSDVIKLVNEKFYAVKFNAEGNEVIKFKGYDFSNKKYVAEKPGRNGTHEFTSAIAPVNGRIAYPTIVYMDENLNIISPVQGFMKPLQILPLLGYISEGAYTNQAYDKYLEAKK